MTEHVTGAEKCRWDLSIFYSGINDPQSIADLKLFEQKAKEFQSNHKGNLSRTLGVAIADYSEIIMLRSKLNVYFALLQSTDVADSKVKMKMAEVETVLNRVNGEYCTFFEIELSDMDEQELEEWYAKDTLVRTHRPYIEYVRTLKPHLLTEEVESALTKRSQFYSGAWAEFFDECEADLECLYNGEKKTLTEMIHILAESKDAQVRSDALFSIHEGLKGVFAKYSAQTLYMITGTHAVEDAERGYENPMSSRNKSNRIPDSVVDALHTAVLKVAAPLAQRYYKLKAVHLGLQTLAWSDRNAPMPFSDTTLVPFEEATRIVLSAYESFSPTLADLVRQTIEDKRIDAPATKGKRGGAFNYSSVLPGHIPIAFTFLNYLGSSRDVMTYAHELGHGVHGLLAGKEQGPLMHDAPTAYCETASVFGEMTTFNFLKNRLREKGDKKALLALLMGKIDDALNTTVRQIGFSNFERRIHGMNATYTTWSEPKKLSVEELSTIWLKTLTELYGEDGVVFTYEHAELLWTYISHFHRPFYVYGYAFGELLTQSLYAKQESLGKDFEPLYLDMLKSGMTKDVVELLKPFDLDPTDERFWTDGIHMSLGTLIEEAEQLSHDIGVI